MQARQNTITNFKKKQATDNSVLTNKFEQLWVC